VRRAYKQKAARCKWFFWKKSHLPVCGRAVVAPSQKEFGERAGRW
jgi:hypothetical protein